jgi:hypothetical protein
MRKALLLWVAVFLLGIPLLGQAPQNCGDLQGCKVVDCETGFESTAITIPLGAVYSLLNAISCIINPATCGSAILEIAAGLTIPDLEIELKRDVAINFGVSCNEGCCPGGRLYATASVYLGGETEPVGIPPTRARVMGSVSCTVGDNSKDDGNPGLCKILVSNYQIPTSGVKVSLVFLGNFVWEIVSTESIPGTAKMASCTVSYGCQETRNLPPDLAVPSPLKVSAGQITIIPVSARDPDGDLVWIYIPSTTWDGAALYYDRELGAYVVYIPSDYQGPPSPEFGMWAYDLRPEALFHVEEGQSPSECLYYHEVSTWFQLEIVANHPPIAISSSERISHWGIEGEPGAPGYFDCFGRVEYKAFDRDLPAGNFGFKLYFIPGRFAENWDCSSDVDLFWLPTTPGLFADCQGQVCSRVLSCSYPCRSPDYPIRPGKYDFPFAVVEYKMDAMNLKAPENYGFSDAGEFTLIVNNSPPVVAVEPEEMRVRPGDTVVALVSAWDEDNDEVTLKKAAGVGSFAEVRGRGRVRSTYTWSVPSNTRPFSYYISFVAKDHQDVAYGFLHIRTVTPPKVYDAYAVVPRGGSGGAWAYVEDPDSPSVSVFVGNVPSGLSVSARVEDDYVNPGFGGFMVEFQVSADQSLCDGEYSIPFTLVDSEGNSSSATLHVRVFGNRPPQVRGELQGEATVTLYPDRVQVSPVALRGEVFDPDGDRVFVEAPGILV